MFLSPLRNASRLVRADCWWSNSPASTKVTEDLVRIFLIAPKELDFYFVTPQNRPLSKPGAHGSTGSSYALGFGGFRV